MEEKQGKCEIHNTYHSGECPICKDEKEEEIYREQSLYAGLIIFLITNIIISLIVIL